MAGENPGFPGPHDPPSDEHIQVIPRPHDTIRSRTRNMEDCSERVSVGADEPEQQQRGYLSVGNAATQFRNKATGVFQGMMYERKRAFNRTVKDSVRSAAPVAHLSG